VTTTGQKRDLIQLSKVYKSGCKFFTRTQLGLQNPLFIDSGGERITQIKSIEFGFTTETDPNSKTSRTSKTRAAIYSELELLGNTPTRSSTPTRSPDFSETVLLSLRILSQSPSSIQFLFRGLRPRGPLGNPDDLTAKNRFA